MLEKGFIVKIVMVNYPVPHVAMQESVCDDGWFNPFIDYQCTAGLQPDEAV